MKILEEISYNKRISQVFQDWIIMASASLYTWKNDNDVEKNYNAIIKSYSKEQCDKLCRLLSITIEALTNEEDFLGPIYNDLNLINKNHAQFFTPKNVSSLMAELLLNKTSDSKKIITISDCCCGSGRLLIDCAAILRKNNINYQNSAYFVAQDIDSICCHMAFIQLSILGMPAIVKCGNSLSNTIYWQRHTFFYYFNNIGLKLKEQNYTNDDVSEFLNSSCIDIKA
jgi:type I restriction-modification system DNA methylase subunit